MIKIIVETIKIIDKTTFKCYIDRVEITNERFFDGKRN